MTKFKDVAHLYLPFLAVVNDQSLMVTGYSIAEDMFQVEVNEDHSDWWNTVNFKPVLKRVQDISKEEMKVIWEIVFGRPFPSSGQIILREDKTISSDPRFIMMSGVERLGIEITGKVWADSDLQIWKYNQHEVSRWLLSKWYDLFQLIENGEAINANNS